MSNLSPCDIADLTVDILESNGYSNPTALVNADVAITVTDSNGFTEEVKGSVTTVGQDQEPAKHFTVSDIAYDLREVFAKDEQGTPFELTEAHITIAARTTTGATVVANIIRGFDDDSVPQVKAVSSWNDFDYFDQAVALTQSQYDKGAQVIEGVQNK